jgi:UDP-glucose 4-epimerase
VSTTLNCGYGRGYSAREVIAAVRRAIGRDFNVNFAMRRDATRSTGNAAL